MTKIKKGDLIELDFIGTFKDSGEIFDLTIESEAKKNKIYDPNFKYKPMKAFVGAGQLLKGIDKKLVGSEIGKKMEFDLEPKEAFGSRNSKLIQLISLNKLRSKKVNPVVGMKLDVDGQQATVRSVNGGRVLLDFNHPFAGKEVHYMLKPIKVFSTIKDKVAFSTELLGFQAEGLKVEGKKVTFKLPNKEKLGTPFLDLIVKQVKKLVPEVSDITIA
jgi:FKBP-type peptidyl-prolyl cis-trans isomerase 2